MFLHNVVSRVSVPLKQLITVICNLINCQKYFVSGGGGREGRGREKEKERKKKRLQHLLF